ncbi:MAG: hypothetical protein WCJ42_11315 [Actinomycetes bacterium]
MPRHAGRKSLWLTASNPDIGRVQVTSGAASSVRPRRAASHLALAALAGTVFVIASPFLTHTPHLPAQTHVVGALAP